MICDEVKEIILEDSGGDLNESERLAFEAHIRDCEGCAIMLRESDGMWSLLDGWDVIEPRADFVARFWDKVSEENLKEKSIFDFIRGWKSAWGFAAALAVLVITSVIYLNVYQPRPAVVAFTPEDEADERLLIEIDSAISRETAEPLDIYGPWDQEI